MHDEISSDEIRSIVQSTSSNSNNTRREQQVSNVNLQQQQENHANQSNDESTQYSAISDKFSFGHTEMDESKTLLDNLFSKAIASGKSKLPQIIWQQKTIKIASWNIEANLYKYETEIENFLITNNLDICFLCEVDSNLIDSNFKILN